MGKTGCSCLSILSCCRAGGAKEESGLPEVKPLLHQSQIPDDGVASKSMVVLINEKEDKVAVSSHLSTNPQLEDIPPASPRVMNIDASDLLSSSEDDKKADVTIPESAVIVIQSAVRTYLARRNFKRCKSVVKMQAAVRGHLVRRQAVGTLRCVQAVVKMQLLVRARRMRLTAESLPECTNPNEVTEISATDMEKYSPTELLVRNGFARLLLASKQNPKPIYISCDPLKPDSAWKWLERWMAAGHTKSFQQEDEFVRTNCQAEGSDPHGFVDSHLPSESAVSGTSFSVERKSELSNSLEQLNSFPVDKVGANELEMSTSTILAGEAKLKSITASEISNEMNSQTEKGQMGSVSCEVTVTSEPMFGGEQTSKDKIETIATVLMLNDEVKNIQGSKRPSAPELADATSKFEELPSLVSYIGDASIPHEPTRQGSVFQITSDIPFNHTYDLHGELQHKNKGKEHVIEAFKTKDHYAIGDPGQACFSENTSKSEDKICACECIHEREHSEASERNYDVKVSSFAKEQSEPSVETTNSISVKGLQACGQSPVTSPRSHVNATGSLGTPSSQVSSSTKTSRKERMMPYRKQKIKLSVRKSPANRNTEFGPEHNSNVLPSDIRNEKEEFSSVAAELNERQHEPRSSISKPLPSYMQPTESARAKFHSSSHMESSDENGMDKYMKKRLSLPTISGSQDSPSHSQQETSHLQRSSKGSLANSAPKFAAINKE